MPKMCSTTENDLYITERFKKDYNEQFYILVRMHLSFLLDLNTDENDAFCEKGKLKKWNIVSFGKKLKMRNVMEGPPLTQEGICQVYQLIEFLKTGEYLKSEGIFRRTGSVERQQDLKNHLNQGITLQLEGAMYNVHDIASVLKGFLAELPEPLLTEAHFPVYYQIAECCGVNRQPTQETKLLEALQLLLLLLPSENKMFLKDILELLQLTSSYEAYNRMSADNLAKLFTPHLLCPRKLTPEVLLEVSRNLFRIVTFMINNYSELFKVPQKLVLDFRARYERKKILSPSKRLNESVTDAASTVFTFVDHERTTKENESNPTEKALAQLYAHIQSLPESSKKRKLVKQFNKENGHGTPLQVVRSGVAKNKTLGDSIKKHIFQKGLAKKKGVVVRTPSTEDILNESIMTPRSRKPVLLVSGTNINTLPKLEHKNRIMDNVREETPVHFVTEESHSKHFTKSKSESDIIEGISRKIEKMNKSESPTTSLSDTFKEYLNNRNMITLSSPVDSSFSSRTDDFNSTDFQNLSDEKMTDSLLYCLDGNQPDSVHMTEFDESEEKELVLKPKQFDEDGRPIIFETSF